MLVLPSGRRNIFPLLICVSVLYGSDFSRCDFVWVFFFLCVFLLPHLLNVLQWETGETMQVRSCILMQRTVVRRTFYGESILSGNQNTQKNVRCTLSTGIVQWNTHKKKTHPALVLVRRASIARDGMAKSHFHLINYGSRRQNGKSFQRHRQP